MQYYNQIESIMRQSGQLVMQYFQNDIQIYYKSSSVYTNVDIENEQFLYKSLLHIIPDAGIISEELGCINTDKDFIWIIDPLDGTKNFIKGLPYFFISIALMFRNQPIVAAIYNPVSQELYYAEKDGGTWLNENCRITILDMPSKFQDIIVAVHYDQFKHMQLQQSKGELSSELRISYRYFGSIALDIVNMLKGGIDFIEYHNVPIWDVIAGVLLISQADGLVNFEYKFGNTICDKFVAGKASIFHQLIDSKICN